MWQAPTGYLPTTDTGHVDLTESGDVASLLLTVLKVAGSDKIELICQTSGGWEGWLQCELAYLIKSGNREERIYGDMRRTDLIWYHGGARPISIELKAIGFGRKPDEFFKDCQVDLLKLQSTKGEFKPVAAVVVPNWGDFDALKGLLKTQGYAIYPAGNCTLFVKEG